MARALALSVAVHVLLLAVRFVSPAAFEIKRTDAALDVVLVNSKSAQKPRKAEVLAQANLDGGGEHDKQRASTPMPAQTETQQGDVVKQVQRQVQQVEEEQRRLMTAAKSPAQAQSQPVKPGEQRAPTATRGQDDRTAADEMAKLEAEIRRNFEHYAKRPKRMQLTATSAQQVSYAQYYDRLRKKIETRGTKDFPQDNRGKPLYGQLIVVINVNRQGKLGYNRDGYNVEAIDVVKSSGNAVLDRQAVAIVRASAPFGVFTPEMEKNQDILEVISTFKFSRNGLETRLQTR